MAIVAAVAGTPFFSTTNSNSYSFASWTPTNGRLYIAAVGNTQGTLAAVCNSLTGNSQTWAAMPVGDSTALAGNSQSRVTLWRCLAAGATTGTLVANFTGTQTGCFIHVTEFTGFDTGGTNGSDAIVQSVGDGWDTGANPSIALAPFGSVDNATFGGFLSGSDPAAGSGFAALSESTYLTPTRFFITEWRADNDTSVDITVASDTGCGIGVEIKAAVAAAIDALFPYSQGGYYPS